MFTGLKTNIRSRIIQAPMAGVSTPEMAAAVSNAGAIGSIGLGGIKPDDAVASIEKTKQLTDRPFNINLFCHDSSASIDLSKETGWRQLINTSHFNGRNILDAPLKNIYQSIKSNIALANAVASQDPKIISFHFGVPDEEIISILKKTGAKLIATATCLEEGRYIMRRGLDGIVAQGFEAGGHRGIFDVSKYDECLSTRALTRLLVENVSIPVIAAGGIMTGRDIASLLSIGAAGVQLGSAFLCCDESSATRKHKELIRSKERVPTMMTRVISGRPARSILTPFVEWGFYLMDKDIPEYPYSYDAFKQMQIRKSIEGDGDIGPFWAGQNASFAQFMKAENIIEALEKEYNEYVSEISI